MDSKDMPQTPNAWGRWGPEDEAGALNFIGAAQVKRAAGLDEADPAVAKLGDAARRLSARLGFKS